MRIILIVVLIALGCHCKPNKPLNTDDQNGRDSKELDDPPDIFDDVDGLDLRQSDLSSIDDVDDNLVDKTKFSKHRFGKKFGFDKDDKDFGFDEENKDFEFDKEDKDFGFDKFDKDCEFDEDVEFDEEETAEKEETCVFDVSTTTGEGDFIAKISFSEKIWGFEVCIFITLKKRK